VPRQPSSHLNDVELAILRVVWKRKKCSVREVHDELAEQRSTRYTSTLKMMQVMCEKGLLRRDEGQRPQLYSAAIPEAQTQKNIVQNMVERVFGGSARKLIMYAVQTNKISREEISEITKLLDQMAKDK
jgi:BlaI family transcriptional regulator, penicillinase repressor